MEIKLVNASLSDWAANEARKKQALRCGKIELKTVVSILFVLHFNQSISPLGYMLYTLRLIRKLVEYSIDKIVIITIPRLFVLKDNDTKGPNQKKTTASAIHTILSVQ